MFTFTDETMPNSDVTFVAVHQDKKLKTGVCKTGMVEFLTNQAQAVYRSRPLNITLQGHIFSQGDLKVKVGSLIVDYPKFLLVQISYEPSIFIRNNTFPSQQMQVDELIRYSLRIDQKKLNQLRLLPANPTGAADPVRTNDNGFTQGKSQAQASDITVTERLSI